jgi:ribosomal protein L7/L12
VDVVLGVVLVLLVVAALLVAAATVVRFRAAVVRRLEAVEQEVAALARHVGMSPTEPDTSDVTAALAKGMDVEAVRLYRLRTGAGLVEAKQAVDEIARRARGGGPTG